MQKERPRETPLSNGIPQGRGSDTLPEEFVNGNIAFKARVDYRARVIALIRAVQGGMTAQYPTDIFGTQGIFVNRIIARVCNEIVNGLDEILKDE